MAGYLSIPGSSCRMLEVTWATVCRNGLRTKSQVSFRDGRGRERTGNPPRTLTSTREREGGREGGEGGEGGRREGGDGGEGGMEGWRRER